MNAKEFVKRVVRAFPSKYQMYKVARLMARHSKPLHIDNAREQLMLIHPKPAYRYTRPKFAYEQTDKDLSIIVPAYNVERFIGSCLESILGQETQVDFEVIVVNDGSTDDTGDVIAKYARKDNRIRVISQRNKGFSGACNTGIDQARGKALMFVDSDDLIAPTHVDALMTALREDECDYVPSGYADIDEVGNQIGQGKPREFMGTAWGRAYWRYVWEDVRFPEGYLYEDTMLPFLIKPRYKNKQIENNGYLYRHTKSSISRNKGTDARCIDTYWIIEELIDEARLLNIPVKDIYELVLQQCCVSVYERRQRFSKEWMPLIFSACRDFLMVLKEESNVSSFNFELSKDIEEAFKTENYCLWSLIGCYGVLSTL